MDTYEYEFHTNCGVAVFKEEHDVIKALFLVAQYEELEVNYDEVSASLRENAYYEKFPLVIVKIAKLKSY